MKFFLDFFPVVLFFVVYKFFGDLPPQVVNLANGIPFIVINHNEPKDAIYFATLVLIIATIIQNFVNFLVYKKLEKIHLISLGILLAFGSLTLAFKDPLFIKWKVSIFNWFFGAAIIGSQYIGKKPLIERMMAQAISVPQLIWRKINFVWGLFFLFVGVVNIYVAYTYDEETWVNFKLFGVMGMTFVFMIAQGIYLAKHALPDDDEQNGSEDENNKEKA